MNHTLLPEIHALWIDEQLGKISASCLASFVKNGHQVYLHSYAKKIADLPAGVELIDANEIIPQEKIIKHRKTGSYALFSDVYRYQLLKQKSGVIYVDCDVYCLKPFYLPEHGHLFGDETDDGLNGAILAMPANGELLNALIETTIHPNFEWLKKPRQIKYQLRRFLGFGQLENLSWGIIGPQAISYYVKKFHLSPYSQPIDVFYSLHFKQLKKLFDPNLNISDITSSRSLAVHLYNGYLRHLLKEHPLTSLNENCILAKMLKLEI